MNHPAYDKLQFFIETAEQHALRLRQALSGINAPVHPEIFEEPDLDTVKTFELFSSRFAKLQDVMGAKLFPLLLSYADELSDTMTFIDKLLKLERLGIIESSDTWLTLRQIRNTITHDYPDDGESRAQAFNEAIEATPILLATLEKVKNMAQDIERKKNGHK